VPAIFQDRGRVVCHTCGTFLGTLSHSAVSACARGRGRYGFARKAVQMQRITAPRAAGGAHLLRHLLVGTDKELSELGIQQGRVAHWRGLSRSWKSKRGSFPRESQDEGDPVPSLSQFARDPADLPQRKCSGTALAVTSMLPPLAEQRRLRAITAISGLTHAASAPVLLRFALRVATRAQG
jgi:hypothetical protein